MRRRPPELVNPRQAHEQFKLSQLNVPTTWDLRQADTDAARRAQEPSTSRPAVIGSVGNNDALTNLLRVLAELGLIDDQTVQ